MHSFDRKLFATKINFFPPPAKLADPGAFEPDDEADVVFDDMVDDYDDEDDAIDAVSKLVASPIYNFFRSSAFCC